MLCSSIKKLVSTIFTFGVLLSFLLLSACSQNQIVSTLEEKELFTLTYGNFDNQLNLFSASSIGEIKTHIVMRNGFFYISNGESYKIMQLNSFGDLLTLFYNAETNPVPSFAKDDEQTVTVASTQKAIKYPFNSLSAITVDSRQYLYAVDQLPIERQEQDTEKKLQLSQVVLRFAADGSFIDYLGQQGPGGTPFPYIKNIFTTKDNELIVVCTVNTGVVVFWFSTEGYLKYTIPLEINTLPNPHEDSENATFVSLDNVVPSYDGTLLYLNLNYYESTVDSASRVQSGVEYKDTLLYPLVIATGLYDEPISIPPYEEVITSDFSKQIYNLSYDFLGAASSGWLFFIIPDSTGYMVQMIHPGEQKILKRHLDVPQSGISYYDFTLSDDGMISALLAGENSASVIWWRSDSLTAALIQ